MNAFYSHHRPPFLEAKYYSHFSTSEILQINSVYYYTFASHYGQFRANDLPYITHPEAMYHILLDELKIFNAEALKTILTHDVDEGPGFFHPFAEIVTVSLWFDPKNRFNRRMLTKTQENKPFYIQAIRECGSWIIILVKLIDRLHNMRDLEGRGPAFQRKQALETRLLFLDLCFALQEVIPEEYQHVPMQIHSELVALCEKYGC